MPFIEQEKEINWEIVHNCIADIQPLKFRGILSKSWFCWLHIIIVVNNKTDVSILERVKDSI